MRILITNSSRAQAVHLIRKHNCELLKYRTKPEDYKYYFGHITSISNIDYDPEFKCEGADITLELANGDTFKLYCLHSWLKRQTPKVGMPMSLVIKHLEDWPSACCHSRIVKPSYYIKSTHCNCYNLEKK